MSGPTRRHVLATGATLGLASTAGCAVGSPVDVAWTYATGAPVLGPPTATDGSVVVHDSHLGLHVVDADTGERRWRRNLGEVNGAHGRAAVADDTVFTSAVDALVALAIGDGSREWRFDGPDKTTFGFPILAGGTVFAVGSDHFCYAVENGTERWRAHVGGLRGQLTVTDGIIFLGNNSEVVALDATTGAERWRYRTGDWTNSPAAAAGVVYAGSYDGGLHAIDATTGDRRWRFPGGETMGPPTVAGDRVYVGNADGTFYAVTTSGTEAWRADIGWTGAIAPPMVAGGNVYVAASELYALDADSGEEAWRYTSKTGLPFLTESHHMSPAAVADGTVYAGSVDGRLFALRPR
jgi:outer membrane protein assembly factor BamB